MRIADHEACLFQRSQQAMHDTLRPAQLAVDLGDAQVRSAIEKHGE
jgi:hypothetical protein